MPNLTSIAPSDLFRIPLIKYEHTEDIMGIKQEDMKEQFVITDAIDMVYDETASDNFEDPTVRLSFDYRIPILSRKPAQTFMQGIAKIGGVLALLKIVSYFLGLLHKK